MPSETPETLFVAHATGRLLHVRACPQLLGLDAPIVATPEQIDSLGTCVWCAKELAEDGRRYFDSVEQAVRTLDPSDEAVRATEAALGDVDYELVWVPPSYSYIAVGFKERAVAWIGRGCVMHVDGRLIDFG
ncbi:hypothetical protein ACWZJV_25970 [Nocardioides sp. WG-D5]|uniref:hypothetical protein n=1 Tax=Nocardioides luteus TaxID=1844 RepID=UPI0018CBD441|nr:hypothetical protein [Nocardioides luteus]MBG6097044.1 hypothetical protein [Nocardioides luteus]